MWEVQWLYSIQTKDKMVIFKTKVVASDMMQLEGYENLNNFFSIYFI
jgi:hypothetical protein